MVRIDRFLQHVMIFPKRKDSKAHLDNGEIMINGKTAKPSSMVKDNDEIIIHTLKYALQLRAHVEKKDNKIYVGYDIISKVSKNIWLS